MSLAQHTTRQNLANCATWLALVTIFFCKTLVSVTVPSFVKSNIKSTPWIKPLKYVKYQNVIIPGIFPLPPFPVPADEVLLILIIVIRMLYMIQTYITIHCNMI